MPPLDRSASVCALVPHHDCAAWLPGALESLLGQTRPPDAVVVIDDASPEPPLDAARGFPEVTFLRAIENVGPYRLVQTVIDHTGFDAYLFQDADDVSHPERLEALLAVGEATGADMVGSHEVELDVTAPEVRRREYPLDVNAALAGNPIAFALLHPTSVVTREAVARAGGFPGLRFSGDVDFLWRAGHVARIVNADRHLYLRRRHPGSLTGTTATGTRSRARREVDFALRARARARAEAVAAGAAPDLSPFVDARLVELDHLFGPELRTGRTLPSRPTGRSPRAARRTQTGPVLVVGGPRNGGDVLAWALDRHPRFELVADADALDCFSTSADRRPVVTRSAVGAAALRLADAHPDARIVSLERDAETTVASLAARPDAHGDYYSERSARSAAAAGGATCELLASALGPDRVLRIALADLVGHPASTLQACLDFLGERPVPGMAVPLVELRVTARPRPGSDEAIAPAEARRRLESPALVAGATLADRLRRMVADLVGDDDVVAVVSRGDESLLELGAGRARHLPATTDGTYARDYPATGDAAVALVERARAAGTTHLLVPAPSAWWLSHYVELRRHLAYYYRTLAADEEAGVLYDLRAPSARREAG